jgi:hypothetical protein
MQITHDFIKAHSSVEIPIKIVELPAVGSVLKF